MRGIMTARNIRTPGSGAITIDRRHLLIGAPLALAAARLIGPAEAASFVPPGYKLAFADDFTDSDVSRINENATGGRAGAPAWRSRYPQKRFTVINQEKQIYVDRDFAGTGSKPLGVQPFSIHNGILTISANRADPVTVRPFLHDYAYTSGCMTSEFTHWQTYGYFEMRAQLPRGKGFWPAFWLLPKSEKWPPEIDIFEGGGHRPTDMHVGEIHGPGKATGNWVKLDGDSTDGFHTYGLLWTPEEITWHFDGRQIFSAKNYINEDMYMLVNLALGSHDRYWIPDPDASTPFPGRFRIDYIRTYSKA
jgi:beta-glucanase (GH16 family)